MHRRDFLRAGAFGASIACLPGMLGLSRVASAAQHFIAVTARRVEAPVFSGSPTTIPFWQFLDVNGQPLQLDVLTGDQIEIQLINSLTVPVNFVIPGLVEDTPVCLPGEMQNYSFTMPATPGSYLFMDAANADIGRAMGLSGALIVRPADGIARLYEGGPAFNREHTLVLSETDSRLNQAIDAGLTYDLLDFEPEYFYVNNLSYVRGGGVELMMGLGENVAMRFVNAGLINYPMHFHGYHVNVATRDRIVESLVIDKDTVPVRPGEVVEVILPVGQQAGLYPLHSHYVPAVTNNGLYAGGGLIMMNAV